MAGGNNGQQRRFFFEQCNPAADRGGNGDYSSRSAVQWRQSSPSSEPTTATRCGVLVVFRRSIGIKTLGKREPY